MEAPPEGHVLTPDGVVRKVCGTLSIMADGCVLGEDAKVYQFPKWADKVQEIFPAWADGEPHDAGYYSAADLYSTPLCAEAKKPSPEANQ